MGSNNCWWHEQQESTLTNTRRHAESWPCMCSVRQEIDCRGTATPDSWCVHSHIQMHKKLPLHAGCDTLPLRKPGAQRDRMGRGHGRALTGLERRGRGRISPKSLALLPLHGSCNACWRRAGYFCSQYPYATLSGETPSPPTTHTPFAQTARDRTISAFHVRRSAFHASRAEPANRQTCLKLELAVSCLIHMSYYPDLADEARRDSHDAAYPANPKGRMTTARPTVVRPRRLAGRIEGRDKMD